MQTVTELIRQYNWLLIPLFWLILSGAVNVLFWFRTPEDWVKFAEKNPKAARFIRIMRAAGFDPVKTLVHLKALINAKAPSQLEPPKDDSTKSGSK